MSYHNISSASKPLPGQGWYGCAASIVSPTVDAAAGGSGGLEGNAGVVPSCGLYVMGESTEYVLSVNNAQSPDCTAWPAPSLAATKSRTDIKEVHPEEAVHRAQRVEHPFTLSAQRCFGDSCG